MMTERRFVNDVTPMRYLTRLRRLRQGSLRRWLSAQLQAPRRAAAGLLSLCAAAALSACSGNAHIDIANSQTANPATVDFPIFYVKRTIPPQTDDLRMLRTAVLPMAKQLTAPKADLYKRDSASPSATETNITTRVTKTDVYDIKDVDVSLDGKKVIFTMRGPLTQGMQQKKPPTWHLWEYVIATDTLQQVPLGSFDPDTSNNVAPHYMPDGRFVFSSTAQRQSGAILIDEGKSEFPAQDEARSEPAFVLHVMSQDRSDFHQISFNQSHDRDPTVLNNGRIMWSRWDHAPGKDGMHLYSCNPDGSDMQLLYGANSHMTGTKNSVIEFVQPKEMQDGRILTLARQYTDVDFGGDLIIIDTAHYVENTQPLLADPTRTGPAQSSATQSNVSTVPGPSPGGRYNSAFPLWDGTNRILVSWTQCRLLDPTSMAIVPCTSARLADPNVKTGPPLYSAWMFDPNSNTLLPVMPPVEGVMVTDIVAAQPRAPQNIILDRVAGLDYDTNFDSAQVGVLDIRSVYDFDGVDTAKPSIAVVADPAATKAAQRPARFVRLVKAVSIPDKDVVNLNQAAFGASDFMREILGYAPVDPDGSVRVNVPANVAFMIEVLDANGRRISPTHNAWLQIRAGEILTCNGCHTPASAQNPHSHGRKGLFAAVWNGAAGSAPFPNTVPSFVPLAGETMAQTRTRSDCSNNSSNWCAKLNMSMNIYYSDGWTNPAVRAPDASFAYMYNDPTPGAFATAPPTRPTSCLDTPTTPSAWKGNCRTVINYLAHIQALWDRKRQRFDASGAVLTDHTCSQAGCHNTQSAMATVQVPAAQLDLTNNASNEEPLQPVSYQHLLFPHNAQEVIMGALQDIPGPPDANGNPTAVSVGPYLNAGSANGALSGAFLARFATGSGSTHAGYLSADELRLISEWLDIGAQFFNDPFDPAAPVN